jgi:crotonobetainyl-CoA:carnitine CoA-transferase CaiB-like acyl-CoA transferase
MDRLGLGYAAVAKLNPRIVFCSITGYGQAGARAMTAAHDLNYIAETGLLALCAGVDGAPVIPPALIADIAGGTYPAVINILLALRERDRTGHGCHLDVAMADNLFAFMYWAMGDGLAGQRWPRPGQALVTGGSPRYQIYRTQDDRFVAAAPLEERFWQNFCDAIGLPAAARDDMRDLDGVKGAVAERIRGRTADEWRGAFAGKDLCCNVVRSIEEAVADPDFIARRLFDAQLVCGPDRIMALPVPIAADFRGEKAVAGCPALGEANVLLDQDSRQGARPKP